LHCIELILVWIFIVSFDPSFLRDRELDILVAFLGNQEGRDISVDLILLGLGHLRAKSVVQVGRKDVPRLVWLQILLIASQLDL